MNCLNVKLYGYCNKLLNIYNYTRIDVSYFRQKYVNFTFFLKKKFLHPLECKPMLKSQRKPNPNAQAH